MRGAAKGEQSTFEKLSRDGVVALVGEDFGGLEESGDVVC